MPSSILNSDDGVISGTSGLKSSGGDDGNLVFQSKGTETARINTDKQIVAAAGTASLPALTTTGDLNTGIFFPAADTIAFGEGGAEAMRIDSSGRVGIGTSSINRYLVVSGDTSANAISAIRNTNAAGYSAIELRNDSGTQTGAIGYANGSAAITAGNVYMYSTGNITFLAGGTTERARIDSSGNLLVGKTATGPSQGLEWNTGGSHKYLYIQNDDAVSGNAVQYINRQGSDGSLIIFRQATTDEGSISVSGSTVSYNGGHLSRWAQMLTKPDLLKGTVMSNLDEMNVYVDADGNPVENEQLNKVKVSDVEGDANVAGVFVNWTYDEAHQVDEINMAMTGDMIIRIAQGVTVARGDLLMSAGDGTAKPQGDDIVRSKTIAKVTSTHVTCTYDDGSYCVPCVLMAC
jgi:hypothetical protein